MTKGHVGSLRVPVQADGRRHFLGLFVAEHDAALAYDAAARRYQGEAVALTNERAGLLSATSS